jgi:hypothetical protein
MKLSMLLLLALLAGCGGNLRLSEEAKLKQELRKFENFSGSGIVELSAFGFSLRKPFAVAKSIDQMRLDVVEGGLFGASGSPLISMYFGEYLALKSTLMPALEALNMADKLPGKPNALFNTADYVFAHYGQEIIQHKAVVRDSLHITFRKNYQLESIVDNQSGIRIDTKYTGAGDLDELNVRTNKGISAKLIFDMVDYNSPQITPLPKPEPGNDSFMDILRQGGMMNIFKGFMGN